MLMIPSLTLNAVKSWLLPHKILRMAKFEKTSTHQYLVMGGLYRLVKCKSTAIIAHINAQERAHGDSI